MRFPNENLKRNLEILGNFIKDLLGKSSGDMTGAVAVNSERLPL